MADYFTEKQIREMASEGGYDALFPAKKDRYLGCPALITNNSGLGVFRIVWRFKLIQLRSNSQLVWERVDD